MTTYEWLTIIGVLIGGFWTLNRTMTKIEVSIKDKVGYDVCSKNRKGCPLAEQIKKLEDKITNRKD